MMITTHSNEETKTFAKTFSTSLKGGEFLALQGELGAGKTTFVQGLAEGLGIKDPVRSPTFALMNIFKTTHPTITTFVHLDCYRLADASQVHHLELEEWLNRNDVVIAMEWPPQKLKEVLGIQKWTEFRFENLSENERSIQVKT